MNGHTGFRTLAVTLALFALPVAASAMDKAQLVDLILKNKKQAFESKAAAERAFDAVISAIKEGVDKDGKAQIIGFGPFTVRRAAGWTRGAAVDIGSSVLGDKKSVKLRYRSGNSAAGVMVRGTNGLYDLWIEAPTPDYLTRPIEIEMKLPKPLTPKIVEVTISLPRLDPQLDALLADWTAFPVLVEVGLPGWIFDGTPPDPAPDYYGEMFPGFHTEVGGDPCGETLLSERLGLGGEPLCPPLCGLGDPEPELDALATEVAAAAGCTFDQARGAIDVLLALPFEPPPGLPIESVNGVGSFAVELRPELRELGGSNGKRVKVKAKQVVHFQGGAMLGPRLEEPPPSD
jgi:nucleoid DNA-binding protein